MMSFLFIRIKSANLTESRRFTVGAQLYELMGIERGDKNGADEIFP